MTSIESEGKKEKKIKSQRRRKKMPKTKQAAGENEKHTPKPPSKLGQS